MDHPNFTEASQLVNKFYLTERGFKDSVDHTAELFLKRRSAKPLDKENEQLILALSVDYLKEECTCMLLWAEEGYHFEIYPNQWNEAMCYIYTKVICKFNPKSLRAVSVKFKNRSVQGLHAENPFKKTASILQELVA